MGRAFGTLAGSVGSTSTAQLGSKKEQMSIWPNLSRLPRSCDF